MNKKMYIFSSFFIAIIIITITFFVEYKLQPPLPILEIAWYQNHRMDRYMPHLCKSKNGFWHSVKNPCEHYMIPGSGGEYTWPMFTSNCPWGETWIDIDPSILGWPLPCDSLNTHVRLVSVTEQKWERIMNQYVHYI